MMMTDRQRNYGIDILRIFAMYMIVIIHLFVKSKVLSSEHSLIALVFDTFLYSLVLCCVNCYALISGYVGYRKNSKYNFGSYFNLWLQVVFYGMVILSILKFTGIVEVSIKNFVEALLPVTRNQYWYFTAYTGVFFIAPAINKMVDSMQEKAIKGFCLICILVFSFYGTFAQNLGGDPFGLEEGYSFVWLSVLYMIGAVIKRFQWDQKILRYKNAKRNLILICIGCVTITTCWYFIVGRATRMIVGEAWGNRILMSYVSPTVLCLSICLLILFLSMKLGKRVIALIKFCAPATFGVYLIHMQPLVAKYIISKSFAWIADLPGLFPTLLVLLVSFAILCVCILIDRMRMLIFKICKINEATEKINMKLWEAGNKLIPH